MAHKDHLAQLNCGQKQWNEWRDANPEIHPDLTGLRAREAEFSSFSFQSTILHRADLMRSNLHRGELRNSDLSGALLNECDLRYADFSGSNLQGANLAGADLRKANLSGCDLRQTDFTNADLSGADLSNSNLEKASLIGARLIRVNLREANLTGCYVYGISVWDADLSGATQIDLIISPYREHSPENPYEAERIPTHLSPDRESERSDLLSTAITVDKLEVAAFIYLLLNNQAIRDVLDTITSKAVLILGRFTPERKRILDQIRDHLRSRQYLPILFDFAGPANRDTTETVSTLAHLARFVVADLSYPSCVPQELMKIVPQLPSLPVQPLLASDAKEYAMFQNLRRYPWVLNVIRYDPESPDFDKTLDLAIRGPEKWINEN